MLNPFFDKFLMTNSIRYKNSNLYLVNIPFVMLPTALLVELASRQDAELNRAIYYSVKEATRKHLMRQFNFDFGLEGDKVIRLVENFFSASGWGRITNLDIDMEKKHKLATVKNSPIAEPLRGKSPTHVDHMLRGIFAGLFSRVFNADVECVEKRCAAMGSENCEFVVKPHSEMDFSKPHVRAQLRP